MPPTTPPPEVTWPIPALNLHVQDLAHQGSLIFFGSIDDPHTAFKDCVVSVFRWLYPPNLAPTNVQSITLTLRSMPGGVAHTFGSSSEKHIHFSLEHIVNSRSRAQNEILGVLTHEIVHCLQYNGLDKCPGGLIEGLADYVRLRASLAPPHWRADQRGDTWDAGYERTGYFLNWIESAFGEGTVMQLNGAMKGREYTPDIFLVTGKTVDELWKMYCKKIDFGRKRRSR